MDDLPEKFWDDDLIYFNYAPISSVDMEPSVLVYKNMFIFENLSKSLIVNCSVKKFFICIYKF